MTTQLPILQTIRIASPCNVAWASMQGNERTRYCGACEKRVYNLVGMSDGAVAELFESQGDDVCIRLYQRHDGTLMTQDCPTGFLAARRRFRRTIGAIGAVATFLLTAGIVRGQLSSRGGSIISMRPFAQIANWLSPTPVTPARPTMVMGKRIAVPSTTPGNRTLQPNCGSPATDNGGAS